jgi:hypothetical protein
MAQRRNSSWLMPSTVCVVPTTAGLSMELTLRETDRAFHTINCAISYINPLYRTAISLYKRCVSAQTVGASIRILCMLRRCEAARRCDDERREPETRRHDAVAPWRSHPCVPLRASPGIRFIRCWWSFRSACGSFRSSATSLTSVSPHQPSGSRWRFMRRPAGGTRRLVHDRAASPYLDDPATPCAVAAGGMSVRDS